MKNKKLKVFLAAMFALSLGLSVSAVSLKANKVESVAALSFGEENPLDPNSQDEEKPETPGDSEQPQGGGEEAAAPEEPATGEEDAAPKESEDKPAAPAGAPSFQEIFDIIKATFKDAWDDLMAHIKRWFKLK